MPPGKLVVVRSACARSSSPDNARHRVIHQADPAAVYRSNKSRNIGCPQDGAEACPRGENRSPDTRNFPPAVRTAATEAAILDLQDMSATELQQTTRHRAMLFYPLE
jgi:hypothetical protein